MKNYGLFFTFIIYYLLFTIYGLYPATLGIDVGSKAIDFSLEEALSTSTFKLSNYEKKNSVLVVFFATWCPYCVMEIPELNKIYSEYGKGGLVVVAVDVQERKDKVISFIKRKKILYKVLLDRNADVAGKFKVYGLPTAILISSNGDIVSRGNGLPDEKEIKNQIEDGSRKVKRQ